MQLLNRLSTHMIKIHIPTTYTFKNEFHFSPVESTQVYSIITYFLQFFPRKKCKHDLSPNFPDNIHIFRKKLLRFKGFKLAEKIGSKLQCWTKTYARRQCLMLIINIEKSKVTFCITGIISYFYESVWKIDLPNFLRYTNFAFGTTN